MKARKSVLSNLFLKSSLVLNFCNWLWQGFLPGAVPLIGMYLVVVQVVVGKLLYVVGFSAGCCAINQDVPCTSCSRETALCSRVLWWVMEFITFLQKLDCKSDNYCTWFNNNLQVCATYQQIHYASQCVEPMFCTQNKRNIDGNPGQIKEVILFHSALICSLEDWSLLEVRFVFFSLYEIHI